MEFDVKKIAKLAKLEIKPEEMEDVTNKFASVLGMIENLPQIDDDCLLVDPQNPMILRKDEVKSEFSREQLLENAPQVQAGCIVVPRVVE